MDIIGVILAKSDSKRLPGKNMKMFHGKPMFVWNMEKCLQIFERTVVSSDSEKTLKIAKDAGAIIHRRTWRLCGDQPNMKVYQDIIAKIPCKGIVAVQANSPTVSLKNILMGKNLLEWGIGEAITKHRNGKFYGSVWSLARKTIEKYTPSEMWEAHPDVAYYCDSIDIHTKADFEQAKRQWESQLLPR